MCVVQILGDQLSIDFNYSVATISLAAKPFGSVFNNGKRWDSRNGANTSLTPRHIHVEWAGKTGSARSDTTADPAAE